jgi:hypothetical protein
MKAFVTSHRPGIPMPPPQVGIEFDRERRSLSR